jgi:beta-lactamase class A
MKKRTVPLVVLILLAGILIGYFAATYLSASVSNANLEFHAGGYRYINPLYECTNSEFVGAKEFRDLETRLNDLIDSYVSDGKIVSASLYFRDLNNGPWFGVNEKADFSPSSLLKLPVMIAYFKEAESDPSILTNKIKYEKEPEEIIRQNYKPNDTLEIGKEYEIQDLITRMIVESDNIALRILENNISNEKINKVTLDLGIPTATESTPEDYINVKDYSALFRVLFNASYLTKELSEKALSILSRVEFDRGLRVQIPKDIQIAHKFGERGLPGGINQLHDCGIVYYPKHPYLACIMTRGNGFSYLEDVIQDISGQIYKEIDLRYRNK